MNVLVTQAVTQTAGVLPGWMVGVPLLVIVCLLVWLLLTSGDRTGHDDRDHVCEFWIGDQSWIGLARCEVCNPAWLDDSENFDGEHPCICGQPKSMHSTRYSACPKFVGQSDG